MLRDALARGDVAALGVSVYDPDGGIVWSSQHAGSLEIHDAEFDTSDRGAGGFGHTGRR